MVGMPLDEGFERVFADLDSHQRQVLLEACVEEEHRLLDEGAAGLLPGTLDTLSALAARGVPMGIASNCSTAYLDAMLRGLGLEQWISEARCLESPGVRNKADMIQDLLLVFGTRSAVMVGDRAGDRDAAWANGLPHVHLSRGYAGRGEDVSAEATIAGLDELPGVLERRSRRVRACLDELALPEGPVVVGVGGPACAGKSLWLRDLAVALEAQGRAVRRVDMQSLRRPDHGGDWDDSGDPLLGVSTAYDLDGLVVRIEAEGNERGEVVLVEGRYLQHSRVLQALDRLVWVDVSDAVGERRLAGRDGRLDGPGPLARLRDFDRPLGRSLARSVPPQGVAHVLLSGENPLE